MPAPPLLFWDFENVMTEGASVSVGIPPDPQAVSGFVSQTGGGPAEKWPKVGRVFVTRKFGANELFIWLTVTRPVFVESIAFTHWHGHTKGQPTHPKYALQLEIQNDDEIDDFGKPLELSGKNSGDTDTIEIGRELSPGNYWISWRPLKLKGHAADTGKDYFAIKNLAIHGRVLAKAEPAPAPAATSAPAPKVAVGGFVDVEVGGVKVERMKVMEAKYGGRCARSGEPFEPGATIAFRHRDALSEAQKAAIFGAKKPNHLMVLLASEEAEEPGEPVACQPDAGRLTPFRAALARKAKGNEWQYGNLSAKSVAYSCGCLTRQGKPLAHRHDPAELALCSRLASEAAARLSAIRLNDEGSGAPFLPYFAAATAGAPTPKAIDEAFIRAAFGGTISPGASVEVVPMKKVRGKWERLHDTHTEPESDADAARAWDEFGKWFTSQPGLKSHCFVRIGASDEEPGATMPRLVVALTPAGSLVGAASFVVYA